MSKDRIILSKHTTEKRASVILIAFALFLSFLIYNIFYLGFFKYQFYLERVFDQITTSSPMRAERGAIYDSNMNALALTETTWRLFISTKEIKKFEKNTGIEYSKNITKKSFFRVHGGGFAGSILGFVENSELDAYVENMKKVFGDSNVFPAKIRATGTCGFKL